MPAAATTIALLFLAFLADLLRRSVSAFKGTSEDLPDLPKTNDFPALYDAQLLAEKLAYEREVEDAHKRTSGGF